MIGINKEEFIKNVIDNDLPKLIAKNGNSNNFKKILSIFLEEYHDWLIEYNNIYNLMDIDTVSDYFLDLYGNNLNVNRKYMEEDAAYRLRIISEIKSRFSNSTIQEMCSFVMIGTGMDENDFEIIENPLGMPASFTIKAFIATDEKFRKIFDVLEFFKPAGVDLARTMYATMLWEDLMKQGDGTWEYVRGHYQW